MTNTNEQYNNKNVFIFPFSTCEKPQKEGLFSQPYSVIVNLVACVILLYFICITKRWYPFLFLITLFIFESFHTFSHAMHIQEYINTRVIHIVAYITIVFMFLSLYTHFKKVSFSRFFYIFMTIMVAADIFSFLFLSFLFYFTTFIIIFTYLFTYFYPLFSGKEKRNIGIIIGLALLVMLLLYNEKYNCKRMMELVPGFPIHIILESVGVSIYYFIGDLFYNM